MERYATKEASAAALVSLGFIRFDDIWFDTPMETETGSPFVQCMLYQCPNKYWCVDVNGWKNSGFSAPVVWDGPTVDWDKSIPLDDFVEWLNQYNPGWR